MKNYYAKLLPLRRSFYSIGNKHYFAKKSFKMVFILLMASTFMQAQSTDPCDMTFVPSQGFTIGVPNGLDVYASDKFPGLTVIIGKQILVNANFIINKDMRFFNCLFKIAPGVKIEIATEKTVYIYNSKLWSCGFRWKGILLTANPAKLILNNSSIENADIGVQCGQNCIFESTATTYNKNQVCIQNVDGMNFSLNKFVNNRFTCTGNLLSSPNLQIPGAIKTYAGIKITNGSLTIGTAANNGKSVNTFSGLIYGILSVKANLYITNCAFEDLGIVDVNFNTSTLGVGIEAFDSDIIFLGDKRNYGFVNNDYGIRSLRTRLKVSDALFDNNKYYGISSRNNTKEETVVIQDNSIICKYNRYYNNIGGIEIERSSGTGSGTNDIIRRNNIIINTSTTPNTVIGYGININGINGGKDYMLVEHNNIQLNADEDADASRTVDGIRTDVFGMNFLQINDNRIYTSFGTRSRFGIYLESSTLGGAQNMVYRDTVNGSAFKLSTPDDVLLSYDNGTLKCGIHQGNCAGINYCQNTMDGCVQGYHAVNSSLNTNLSTTGFGRNFYGLFLEQAAFDDQICHGNTFLQDDVPATPTSGYIDNYHETVLSWGSTTPAFRIRPNNDPERPDTGNPDPSTWFLDLTNCNTNIPPSTCPVLHIVGYTPDVDRVDTIIARGHYEAPTAFLQWNAQRQLFEKFRDYSSAYIGNSDLSQFMSAKSGSNLDKFGQVESAVAEALLISPSLKSDYTTKTILLDSIRAEMVAYDILIDADSTNEGAIQQKASLSHLAEAVNANINYLNTQIRLAQATGLLTAAQLNNGIVTAANYESAEKAVNQIRINALLNNEGVLDSQQIATLQYYATLCSDDYGIAVNKATALLNADKRPDVMVYDGACTNSLPPLQAKLSNGKNQATALVYPNPANNEVNFSSNDKNLSSVQIYDLYGKQIYYKDQIGSKKFSFSCSLIGVGTYKIVLISEDGSVYHSSLVIQR